MPRPPPDPTPTDGFDRSLRVTRRAAELGFDWARPEDVLPKVREEVDELQEAMGSGARERVEHELGDLLFAVVNLARHLDLDPRSAVAGACARFEARFGWIERALSEQGRGVDGTAPAELEELWQAAKRELA